MAKNLRTILNNYYMYIAMSNPSMKNLVSTTWEVRIVSPCRSNATRKFTWVCSKFSKAKRSYTQPCKFSSKNKEISHCFGLLFAPENENIIILGKTETSNYSFLPKVSLYHKTHLKHYSCSLDHYYRVYSNKTQAEKIISN